MADTTVDGWRACRASQQSDCFKEALRLVTVRGGYDGKGVGVDDTWVSGLALTRRLGWGKLTHGSVT